MAEGLPTIHFAHRLLRAHDWQDRPQLDALCRWWQGGGEGACALVGIGGAGKTAITDRFLQLIPGVTEKNPDLPKRRNLPMPARVVVFSFYEDNEDRFFQELAVSLGSLTPSMTGDDKPELLPSSQQVIAALVASAADTRKGRVMLVLDGLEEVQDSGARGGPFGQILDGRLRDFVFHVATGWVPGVSVLITSRFRLFVPRAKKRPFFRQIDVAQLSPDTSVALLRERGVRKGSKGDLKAMARNHGHHALTIDLIGGYIARFCGGDPEKLPPEPHVPDAEPIHDPDIAAMREQERKLAQVAKHYGESFAETDPVALALLQRICLFRLGVSAQMLVDVFTGEDKTPIAGGELAALTPDQLKERLDLLVEMRLLEVTQPTKRPATSEESVASDCRPAISYTIHPAVRDGFLAGLDEETARRGHDAIRQGLEATLDAWSIGTNPSDPATLDLLEEIVHHTREAGHAQLAFDVYSNQIGGYQNLSWCLGAYERGERICRDFASGKSPHSAPLPEGLSEHSQAAFINDWVLYLKNLGRLDAAARRCKSAIDIWMKNKKWKNASIGNRYLSDVELLAGRLSASLRAAEEALLLAERDDNIEERWYSHTCCAYVRVMQGQTAAAQSEFDKGLACQREYEGQPDRPLYGLDAIWYALLLAHLGQYEEAKELTQQNIGFLGPEHQRDAQFCNLVLAHLMPEHGKLQGQDYLPAARNLQTEAHKWAIARGAQQLLCWSVLVRARIELDAGPEHYQEAGRAAEDGLRIAREYGYGIHYIDLLLVRARLRLLQGDASAAAADIRTALTDGVPACDQTGSPALLAADDPECLYAWRQADGRHLLAEALCLQAAQALGKDSYTPRSSKTPQQVRHLVKAARRELQKCVRLRRRIRDATLKDTEQLLESLKKGRLTEYPIGQPDREKKEPLVPATTGSKLFISYAHKDEEWLDKLQTMIAPAVPDNAVSVWCDDKINPGEEWRDEIDKSMAVANVAVLLVSPNFLAAKFIRETELPYLLEAVKKQKATLIWMLLSNCLYEHTDISNYQAAHDISRPLDSLSGSELNDVLVKICTNIEQAWLGDGRP